MRVRKVRTRSSKPILEILVAILLIGGAGTAIWIVHSSLPAPKAASTAKIMVAVSPASAKVATGKTLEVAATVSGTDNAEVDWSVQEGDRGGRVVSSGAKAAGGKVWLQAIYSAPRRPGTYHLLAESKADPDKSSIVVITVVNR
jgi:hypothetical protein